MNLLIGAISYSIKIGAIELSWIDILLHLLNFAILVVGLTFLLYKPVLKFINKRKEDIQNEIKKGEDLQESAKAKLEEYQAKLSEAETEAETVKQTALADAEVEKKKIIESADAEAKRLIENANKDCVVLKKQAVEEVKNGVTDAVIEIATKVIEREVSKEDNQKLIDDCLEKWSSDVD